MVRHLLLILFLASACHVYGTSLRGHVNDKLNGEPLVGATVLLKNTKYGTSVGLDGIVFYQEISKDVSLKL